MAAYYDRIPLSPSVGLSAPGTPGSADLDDCSSFDDGLESDNRQECRQSFAGIQCWTRYRKDYTKGAGEKGLATQFHQFFELPTEIRYKILGLLMTASKELEHMPEDRSMEDYGKIPFDTRIFAVNKQLLAEAQTVFYSQNDFLVNVYENLPLPLWIREPSSRPVAEVRRVHLWIFFNTEKWSPDMGPKLRSIFTVLASSKLTRLRITPICQTSWYNDEIDGAFDKILSPAEMIKGVDEVIFTNRDSMRSMYMLYEHLPVGTEETSARLKKSMESAKAT